MKPILFILSGLPASGKSTLSKLIAKEYKAVYVRIDTIEQGLKDICNCRVESEGYQLSYRIAIDNLKIGNNVVADSCNPILLTRKEWNDVAGKNDSLPVNIEVICSDEKEHKKRIETRTSDVEGIKLPSWDEVKKREFDAWTNGNLTIDTAHQSIEASFFELKQGIQKYFEKNQF